jgi:hypothetical protein
MHFVLLALRLLFLLKASCLSFQRIFLWVFRNGLATFFLLQKLAKKNRCALIHSKNQKYDHWQGHGGKTYMQPPVTFLMQKNMANHSIEACCQFEHSP